MSDVSDISRVEQPMPPVLSHRRILLLMAAVLIIGSAIGFIFVSGQFGAGVVFGGGLSFANYYWLKVSLKKLFAAALAHGGKPKLLAVRYFVRYVALGSVLTVVSLTNIVPVVAVILGLASFALAIVVEGFVRLFSSIFNSGKI